MRKGVLVSIAALLAACGAVATTSNDTAESAPPKSGKAKKPPSVGFRRYDQGGMAGCFDPKLSGSARAAAERIGGVPCEQDEQDAPPSPPPSGDAWIGEYRGQMDGGNGFVSIRAGKAANRYAVTTEVVQPGGCSGSVSGIGTVASVGGLAGKQMAVFATIPEEQRLCRVTLDRSGSVLRVSEGQGCSYFHGMSCEFNGNVTRIGAAASRTGAGAQNAAWVVGAWVARSRGCAIAGEADMTISADGTYVDDDAAGDWTLAGNILTLMPRETAELGEDPRPIRNPQPVRINVTAAGRNGLTMRRGGETWTLIRCR